MQLDHLFHPNRVRSPDRVILKGYMVIVGGNDLLCRSLIAAELKKPATEDTLSFISVLLREHAVLSIMFISLCNILLSTFSSRDFTEVCSTEPAFFISLLSFFESQALMLPSQRMTADKTELSTTACTQNM